MGLLSVLMLAHELAHSLVARKRGIVVCGIVMLILGGVSELQADAKGARDEFLIAIVGPVTSFLLSAILFGISLVLGGGDSPLEAMVLYLTIINLLLGGFNLLPVFPLDEGKVLRSVIWAITVSYL